MPPGNAVGRLHSGVRRISGLAHALGSAEREIPPDRQHLTSLADVVHAQDLSAAVHGGNGGGAGGGQPLFGRDASVAGGEALARGADGDGAAEPVQQRQLGQQDNVLRAGLGEDATVEWFDGVANLGNRPTVDGTRLLFEIHLFDFDRDIYGENLRAALIEFIRPEFKFEGLDALKDQIAKDCAAAQRILRTRAAGAT